MRRSPFSSLVRWLPLSPALIVVGGDAWHRGARILGWSWGHKGAYLLTVLESAALWGALLTLAARRHGRMRWVAASAFLMLGTTVIGTERYFYEQYGSYLNIEALQFGASFPASVKGQLLAQLRSVLWAELLPLLCLTAILFVVRRRLHPRATSIRAAAILAPCALAGALLLPCSDRTVQAASPDVIGLHTMARFARSLPHPHRLALPGYRTPVYVPAVVPNVETARRPQPRATAPLPTRTGDAPPIGSAAASPEQTGDALPSGSTALPEQTGDGSASGSTAPLPARTGHASPSGSAAHSIGTEATVSAIAPPDADAPGYDGRRNVLLVITESVRHDVVCPADSVACETTPFTTRAAPDRIVLRQMRANSSTTAIELAVMWSGLPPTEARNAILAAPLVFDYARAGGYDAGFWTAHHPMFANTDAFIRDLPVSHRATATDLEPSADIDLGANDALLTARALQDLAQMSEPWLGVVQYSNTHFPYRLDDDDQPFQPSTASKAPEDNPQFFNYYRNAVYAQDKQIAALVEGVRKLASGPRTVVVFTSDHGEAFREHGQMGHTSSLLDEEVHVPAWLDAPPQVLMDRERASLAALADAPTWHLDIAPTVLDLLGLWTVPELARYTRKMTGVSLLRGVANRGLVPMTNCTQLWGCAFKNWGMMRGFAKVEARQWDGNWNCWDLETDPREASPSASAVCQELARESLGIFGALPKDAPEMPELE